MKTVEELLKPRWKVIADFPFNTYYKVGGVITDDRLMAARNENGHAVFACEWNDYPNIFRKLEWWEEREPEDIGFVKWISEGQEWVAKVLEIKKDGYFKWKDGWDPFQDTDLPATEQEYIDYIEKQKQL